MQVGDTVSLRVATPAGPTDVVGTLLATSAELLTLRRRDGTVTEIAVGSVVTGRVVPPGPARRITVGDLQVAMAAGWRASETGRVGEWLLRAAGGFTGRANSALPVGSPGMPLAAAVDDVSAWYAERGLAPAVQLPRDPAFAAVAAELDDRGWIESGRTLVMTADLGPVLRAAAAGAARAPASGVDVRVDDAPDDGWLAAYRPGSPDRDAGGALPPAARALLTGHDNVVFASVRAGGRCVAIARAAVDRRWAGLSGVEVDPARRRQRLGTAVTAAALREAVTRGARHCSLQVAADNAAAIALWEQLGFAVHHDYVYRTPPSTPPRAAPRALPAPDEHATPPADHGETRVKTR